MPWLLVESALLGCLSLLAEGLLLRCANSLPVPFFLALQVDEASSVVVLDTAAGQWLTQGQAGHGDDIMRRCRHAMASVGPYIFVHGGLKGSTLLEDVLLADDSSGAELSICDPRSSAWQQWINSMHGSEAAAAALANAAAEEAAAAAALSMRRVGNTEDLRCLDEDLDENMRLNKVSWQLCRSTWVFIGSGLQRRTSAVHCPTREAAMNRSSKHTSDVCKRESAGSRCILLCRLTVAPLLPLTQLRADGAGPGSPKSVTLAQRRRGEFPPARDIPTPDVRLYHRAVVVAQDLQVWRAAAYGVGATPGVDVGYSSCSALDSWH